MTPSQKLLVQQSFEKVLPIRDQAAALFYNRLFTLDPALRPLFTGDIKEQGAKLITMIAMAVNGLDRLETILPTVEDLDRRHLGYGVLDEHYETVGAALLWTLEQGLGPEFTPETKDAWISCYQLLADAMKKASPQPVT